MRYKSHYRTFSTHQGIDNMMPDDVYYRRKPLPKAV